MLDIAKISLKDNDVWDMICEGNVKGCFQIESQLCRQWCKKLKPRNILELSDLIALVRPGCLQSKTDGKSVAQQYADRKNNREEVVYLNQALEKYLNTTLGLIIYQENLIAISRGLCGFDKGQANKLRKGVGKKDAQLLFSLEKEFIEGSKKVGLISEEEAKKIFDGIKASARYLFNKCLSPNTLCQTKEGKLISIKNIQIGSYIKTPQGYSKVINKHHNGIKKVYRITTESNKKIECTIDHKFLCDNGQILPLYEIIAKKYKIICDNNERGNMQAEKIINIELIGEMETMDIEIDSLDHIFFGNGIATSNSHSVRYAVLAYQTVYLKYHHPILFYTEKLKLSHEKIDPDIEKKELIQSANADGISVYPPSLKLMNEDFIFDNDKIYYGFCHVKNVGVNEFHKLKEINITDDWTETAINLLDVNKRVVDNLISIGVFDYNMSRSQQLHHLSCLRDLSELEINWLKTNYIPNDLEQSFELLSRLRKDGGGVANTRRLETVKNITKRLKNPGRVLEDIPSVYAATEEKLLGVSLLTSFLDGCLDASFANMTCAEFLKEYREYVILSGIITAYREHIIKKSGEKMCFLTLKDDTAEISNIVIFPSVYEEYNHMIYEGATVLIEGKRQIKDEQVSLIVDKVHEI